MQPQASCTNMLQTSTARHLAADTLQTKATSSGREVDLDDTLASQS